MVKIYSTPERADKLGQSLDWANKIFICKTVRTICSSRTYNIGSSLNLTND